MERLPPVRKRTDYSDIESTDLVAALFYDRLTDANDPDTMEDDGYTKAADDTFTPPEAVQRAARRGLDVRATKPPSQRGGTAIGLARARQLANGQPLSYATIKRMKAYFDRHAVDKQGSTWGEQGKGWQAWMLWGGDAGAAWARGIVARMEKKKETE